MSAQVAAGVVALATLRAHELQLACVQSLMGSQVSKLEMRMVDRLVKHVVRVGLDQ